MNYQGYLIDLDGTIYQGKRPIPAGKRFIERLQMAKIPFLFVTNNSTRSPKDVVKNLELNHEIHVDETNVYTTALATADYVKQIADASRRSVYAIGESGLINALTNVGATFTETNPKYVIVGLDTAVTYHQFELATLAVRAGATFIGTNADTNLPNERGMVPGAGSLVKLVEYATQTKPIMIGKPESIIMKMAQQRIGIEKERLVMVGDNYLTDIQAGINFQMPTMLVYSGLSTKAQVAKMSQQPTHAIDSLDDWQLC